VHFSLPPKSIICSNLTYQTGTIIATITLISKWLVVANALAYNAAELIITVKKFYSTGPGFLLIRCDRSKSDLGLIGQFIFTVFKLTLT